MIIKNLYRKFLNKKIREKIYLFRLLLKDHKFFIVKKNSYNEDALATNVITDFLENKKFLSNYQKAAQGTNLEIRYRAYIVNYFAEYALNLFKKKRGCFIELGVHKALLSKFIVLNNKFKKNLIFYLFDTYKGIPMKNLIEKNKTHIKFLNKNIYSVDTFDFVKKKFKKFPFVKLVRGNLPDSLNNKNINLKNIQFLHIDLNNAYPEIESIKKLYKNILPGAPVILDDYCFSKSYIMQKNCWDKFAKEKKFKILSLPTGQGIFFKNKD